MNICMYWFLSTYRLPFQQTQRLEPEGKKKFAMASLLVVKMKANAADTPYVFEKRGATWRFTLVYAQLSSFLPNAHQYLAASRLPYAERGSTLQVTLGPLRN
jgi:factor associated with neutral sphingomyelinase activation